MAGGAVFHLEFVPIGGADDSFGRVGGDGKHFVVPLAQVFQHQKANWLHLDDRADGQVFGQQEHIERVAITAARFHHFGGGDETVIERVRQKIHTAGNTVAHIGFEFEALFVVLKLRVCASGDFDDGVQKAIFGKRREGEVIHEMVVGC